MNFYMLRHDGHAEADVYVNREDFDQAVSEAVDEARHGTCSDAGADEIERQVRARTHTCASLAEADNMVEPDADGMPQWREAGRSHDGGRQKWNDADYRGGNAELYRQAADSLRKAGDETMGYDQGRFHDPGLDRALSIDHVDAESRVVSNEMAGTIRPCETAACAAGHVYVCARGWRSYLQTCCTRSENGINAPGIGNAAAAELGMSLNQQWALFPAEPEFDYVVEAFRIEPDDWTCPSARTDEIELRWEEGHYRAADMAVVLETLARRCDHVNAFVATIDN